MTFPIGSGIAADSARDAATIALMYAQRYGWPIPERIGLLEAIRGELAKLVHSEPPTRGNITAKNAAAVMKAFAAAQIEHRELVAVAHEASTQFAAELTGIITAQIPDWVDRLCKSFDEAAAEFLTAVAGAPLRELNGNEGPETVEAFMTSRRLTSTLDWLLAARFSIGQAAMETGLRQATPWIVLEPPAQRTVDAQGNEADSIRRLREFVNSYGQREWNQLQAIDRWQQLASFGDLRMVRFRGMDRRDDRWRGATNAYGDVMLTPLAQQLRIRADRDKRDRDLKARAALAAGIINDRDANTQRVLTERAAATRPAAVLAAAGTDQ
jgi:hypothetical protein